MVEDISIFLDTYVVDILWEEMSFGSVSLTCNHNTP